MFESAFLGQLTFIDTSGSNFLVAMWKKNIASTFGDIVKDIDFFYEFKIVG